MMSPGSPSPWPIPVPSPVSPGLNLGISKLFMGIFIILSRLPVIIFSLAIMCGKFFLITFGVGFALFRYNIRYGYWHTFSFVFQRTLDYSSLEAKENLVNTRFVSGLLTATRLEILWLSQPLLWRKLCSAYLLLCPKRDS